MFFILHAPILTCSRTKVRIPKHERLQSLLKVSMVVFRPILSETLVRDFWVIVCRDFDYVYSGLNLPITL